jgi:hypothetical protein
MELVSSDSLPNLDFSHEIEHIKTLNKRKSNESDTSNIIDSVINKIIEYNSSISLDSDDEIHEDNIININELHQLFMAINENYKNQKSNCIVIFQILREFFLSKLVEDNDKFYDELMSSSHVLSFDLVKYICELLNISIRFNFMYNNKTYTDILSETHESTNIISYEKNNEKIKISVLKFLQQPSDSEYHQLDESQVLILYNYYRLIKLKMYYNELYKEIDEKIIRYFEDNSLLIP